MCSFRCGDPTNSGAVAEASSWQDFTSIGGLVDEVNVRGLNGSVDATSVSGSALLWPQWKNDDEDSLEKWRTANERNGMLAASIRPLAMEFIAECLIGRRISSGIY